MDPVKVEILMGGNLSKGMDNAKTKTDLLDASLKRLAITAGGVFTMQKAAEFAKTVMDVRAEIESLSISFETLLGSKEAATQFFGELKDFAVKTPLLLKDLAGGAQTMLGFNIEAEKVIPTLKQIGDISMGDSERFKSLTLAFSQMSATGKLMGQDLLQMINAGFNPLTVMAQTTGKSISQLKDEMSAGAISSEMVAQAFADATAEGGKFHGMLEKQSKGLKGQISNLQGAIDDMFNSIGEKSEGLLTGSVEMATSLVKNYEEVGKAILTLVSIYGAYRAALIATIVVQKAAAFAENIRLVMMFRRELGLMTAAQQAFNITAMANPYILLATAIMGVVAAMAIYSDSCKGAAAETERITDREKEQADALAEKKTKIEECISAIQDENVTQQDKEEQLQTLKKLMPSVFGQYKTEKELIDNLTKARAAYNEELREEKNLKGVGNLKADQQRLSELKRYKELWDKSMKSGRGSMTIDEQKELKSLGGKYGDQVNSSKDHWWQSYSTGIGNMIKNTSSTIWKDTQQVRTDLHNKFMGELNSMNADEAKKTIDYYTNCIAIANKEGKKLYQLPGESVATSVDELQNRINTATSRMKTIHENASKDFMNDAKKSWTDAQKKVKEVIANRNDRSLYPDEASYQAALKKARDNEKSAKSSYESNGGDTSKNKKKTTGLTAAEKENVKKAEADDRQRQIEESARKLAATEKQSEFEIRQAKIDAMEEGLEKELATVNLNYDKLMEANRLREEEWVKELQKSSDLSFEQAHPDWKKQGLERPKITSDDLSTDQKDYLAKYTAAANVYQTKATADLYKNLLDQYKTYEQQRQAVAEKYAKQRALIEKGKDANGKDLSREVKDTALTELAKKEKNEIRQINDTELGEMDKSNQLLVSLFTDTSQKSVAEIQKIIDKIKLLLDYMSATKDENGTAVIKDKDGKTQRTISKNDVVQLGFSPEQLKTLGESPEKLKALVEQYNKLKQDVLSKNPFKALAESVSDLFKKGADDKDNSLEKKVSNLGKSASEAADMVGSLAGQFSEMFEAMGNDSMAQAASDVQDVMSTVSNIGKGFAEGGLIGGIAAAAGEAIGWVTKAFQANARHKAALEKIMQETIAQQRAYNLLLKEQNLEYEKAETIFGTDSYGKAANAVTVMKDAYADLKKEIEGTAEQQNKFAYKNTGNTWLNSIFNSNYSTLKDAYSGLADIEIKTGHKKTGLFGWGKGKDTYSSILDVYPELIDSAGTFNRELAESIMNSREFADNDKEALQYIIDLYDQAEDAWQEVKDYFTDVFGDLGSTLSSALVDAFRNGTDAGKKFVDSVTEMLETLAEQMIYTVTIAPYLEKAQEDMLGIMKNNELTDEQKFENYVSILDGMTDGILSQQSTYNSLLEKYKEMAAEKGFDLWEKDSSSQTGKTGAYEAASQESITKLEGLYTSMLIYEASIDTNVENVAENMLTALNHLRKIEANTASCSESLEKISEDMATMKNDISTLKRDGIKTR